MHEKVCDGLHLNFEDIENMEIEKGNQLVIKFKNGGLMLPGFGRDAQIIDWWHKKRIKYLEDNNYVIKKDRIENPLEAAMEYLRMANGILMTSYSSSWACATGNQIDKIIIDLYSINNQIHKMEGK